MADERLRELERRFRETGTVEDEAAWLRARLHAGELTEDDLALAAFVGHAASEALLAHDRGVCVCGITREGQHLKRCALYPAAIADTPHALRIPPQLKQWARVFDTLGPQAAGRAAVALARAVAETLSPPQQAAATSLLALAEAWIACPCAEHRERLLEDTVGRARQLPYHGDSRAVWAALWGTLDGWSPEAQPPAGARIKEAVGLAKKALNERKVRAAIRAAILPWALGLEPLEKGRR